VIIGCVSKGELELKLYIYDLLKASGQELIKTISISGEVESLDCILEKINGDVIVAATSDKKIKMIVLNINKENGKEIIESVEQEMDVGRTGSFIAEDGRYLISHGYKCRLFQETFHLLKNEKSEEQTKTVSKKMN
jgi:hypothetical protein